VTQQLLELTLHSFGIVHSLRHSRSTDPSAFNIGKIGNILPRFAVGITHFLHFRLHAHADLCFSFHCRLNGCSSELLSKRQIFRDNAFTCFHIEYFVRRVFLSKIVTPRIRNAVFATRRVQRINLRLIVFLNTFSNRRTDSWGYVVRKEARLSRDSTDNCGFLSICLLLAFATTFDQQCGIVDVCPLPRMIVMLVIATIVSNF